MKKNSENTARALLKSLRDRRITRAVIKSIPYVGSAIDEAIWGGDIERALDEIRNQGEQRTEEILESLRELLPDEQYIVVVGSGNSEQVLAPTEEVRFGRKHAVEAFQMFGGSGVNYCSRLMASGHAVYPILAVGNDEMGKSLQRNICACAAGIGKPQVAEFLANEEFLVPGIATACATIISHDNDRTILSHNRHQTKGTFHQHVLNRLSNLKGLDRSSPSALVVGHIPAPLDGDSDSGSAGTTKLLIDEFTGKCPVFLNFGSSQLRLGYEFWRQSFKKAALVQLNLSEAKLLFDGTLEHPSLQTIMEFLSEEEITIVITLERFGAVASMAGHNGLVLAWPLLERPTIKDPTGAGDAFLAGITASLQGSADFGFHEFCSALDVGRRWAAYACTTLGGSSSCPSGERLEQYFAEIIEADYPPEVYRRSQAEHVLKLIEMSYR